MPSIISATTTNGLSTSADNSGSLQLATNNGTTALTIDTSQRVGIGTTTPANILELKAATPIQIFNQTTGNSNQGIQFQANGATYGRVFFNAVTGQCDTRAGLNNGDGYYLTYSTDGSERMRVPSDGGVRIAMENFANAPSSTNWGVSLNNTGSGSRFFGQGTGTETQIEFGNRNGTRGSIQTNSTNTLYNTSSDYRLKENVAPMTGALTKVALLKPCTYTWKVDGSDGQGFIAHELKAVIPDAVTGEKDAVDDKGDPKYQMVDTSFLVATLTAAIQELNAKVEAQAVRIAELEGAK